jgi:hypothetical protein
VPLLDEVEQHVAQAGLPSEAVEEAGPWGDRLQYQSQRAPSLRQSAQPAQSRCVR